MIICNYFMAKLLQNIILFPNNCKTDMMNTRDVFYNLFPTYFSKIGTRE